MPRVWSLDRRGSKASGAIAGIPITVCPSCFEPYRRTCRVCPHCGHYSPPAVRSGPDFVDGDLEELDPAVLAAMREAVADVDKSIPERRAELAATGLPHVPLLANINRHSERQDAQQLLRAAMEGFCRRGAAVGWGSAEIHRGFFHAFGVDVMTARALGRRDAEELTGKINLCPPSFFA